MDIRVGDSVKILTGKKLKGKIGEVVSVIQDGDSPTVCKVKVGEFTNIFVSYCLERIPDINYGILIDLALDTKDERWFNELHAKKQLYKIKS